MKAEGKVTVSLSKFYLHVGRLLAADVPGPAPKFLSQPVATVSRDLTVAPACPHPRSVVVRDAPSSPVPAAPPPAEDGVHFPNFTHNNRPDLDTAWGEPERDPDAN